MGMTDVTRRRLASGFGIALLFVVYVGTAKLGLALDAVSGFATLVWPPTGIALAALFVFDKKLWPAIAVGAFVVNFTAGAPIAAAIGIAIGNTLEAVVGTWILRHLQFDRAIARVRDALVLVLGGAVVGTLISATIGVTSLWAGGVIAGAAIVPTWRAWWIGDALGVLIIAAFLLVWSQAPRTRESRGRLVEATAAVAAIVLTTLYVFDIVLPSRSPSDEFRTPYFVFPAVMWAAIRFRQRGATTGALVVWTVTIVATVAGHGPFAAPKLSESLLPLQLFMAVVSLATLFLGAAVCERDGAVRARDEFLAVASHELRTPLAALTLQIASLQAQAGANTLSPDKLRTKLDVLERQGDRMTSLAESMLDVSRIMAGQFELANEQVDITAVICEAVARFRDQATHAGCELILDIRELAPITGDRMRIDQIATNLLSNAIRFGRGKPIEVQLTEAPTAIVLRVRDHGVGIARGDQARIFEKFERAGTRRPSSGLGLGLWIVRQILTPMGGSIQLASELGEGAMFTVTIPKSGTRAP